MYNLTNVSSANTIVEMAVATNSLSGGIFMTALMLIMFILFIVVFKKDNFKKVLLAASFFQVVAGTILFVLGLVSQAYVVVPVILTVGSLIAYYFVD